MGEAFSRSIVERTAHLARLALDDAQIARFTQDLQAILEHVETLNELDVSDVEPMAHPSDLHNHLAPDVRGASLTHDQFINLVPSHEGGLLAVPRVLGQEGSVGGDA